MPEQSPAASPEVLEESRSVPVVAGVVAAVVGFSSSFVVVLAGLGAVGASPQQAASGLLALCLTQAAGMAWLAWRHRTPIALAWSTPGAALLLTTGAVDGGWPAAVGAFLLVGVLILLTGLLPWLGALIARIPAALARAMLAGVLLPICLTPVTGLAADPWLVAPVVLTWLVLARPAPRWAVPASLVAALVVVVVEAGGTVRAADLAPTLTWTTPTLTAAAAVSIALPVWIVTMASQNVPGVAVMTTQEWSVPWRSTRGVTGTATLLGAPLGGHAVNLAAITAAMVAGPLAGADRARRWWAALSAAAAYVVLGLAAAALATLVAAAPGSVIPAAAGLALLGTFATSLTGALAEDDEREAAAICFLVAASGISVAGIGAAFWALVAGLLARALLHPRFGTATAGQRPRSRLGRHDSGAPS
ncbi:benzoate/H(+) symporter BenE family transporter [Nocardioides sp.]|uniref:benzoate/H(+) symporter BenE family transporter n=1 Tax=Nocardioides sp. TaxID=35761 RepID=UPI003519B8C8